MRAEGTPAMNNNDIILATEDLTKEFAGFIAVNGVDLQVRRGTIHALIGPNGAGKTTCFNLLTKFLQPTRGRILFKGEDISAMAARPRALVPDLGRLPAYERAGKRAHRLAAAARRLVRFLAADIGAR
jgi:ABC-type branched-subunit amino acid transport system ATPase component